MNFCNSDLDGLPARCEKPQNAYGVTDKMLFGMSTSATDLQPMHPLEKALNKPSLVEIEQFNLLRKQQGIHAPLRLKMEQKAALQIQRLPCLSSSHFQLDVLLGRDAEIGFEDFLNSGPSEHLEPPHVMVEKKLGMI